MFPVFNFRALLTVLCAEFIEDGFVRFEEQLGLEAEFDQHVLPDGKCTVDAFIFVFDAGRTEGRTFER